MNAGTDAEVETTTAGMSLLFVQAAQKFMSRYATFGFNNDAELDVGTMWPTAFV